MAYVQKLTSTRAGTIALAALAALIAALSIAAYLNHYRSSVDTASNPVSVLVAGKLIEKGTPGAAVSAAGALSRTTVPESQLREGALSDPALLRERVAAHDVYPGQQLTASDFVAGNGSLAGSLTKAQRMITIPLDSAHGLIGEVQAGDHVDVFAGFNVIPLGPSGVPLNTGQSRPVLKLVMQDIAVTGLAEKAGGVASGSAGQTTNVSLRVTNTQAQELAFASDNGKLWLVLRPAAGARPTTPRLITVETMLLGIPPITIAHSLGGRR
jgi:Flp pilus assembly protein CpaB